MRSLLSAFVLLAALATNASAGGWGGGFPGHVPAGYGFGNYSDYGNGYGPDSQGGCGSCWDVWADYCSERTAHCGKHGCRRGQSNGSCATCNNGAAVDAAPATNATPEAAPEKAASIAPASRSASRARPGMSFVRLPAVE